MRRQVSVSKTLDRLSKETLGFNIQVEKPIFKEAGQSRAYSGLADTADASEEYAHVAAFDSKARKEYCVAVYGFHEIARPNSIARRDILRDELQRGKRLFVLSRLKAAKMTAAQIAEAQRLAREWVQSHPLKR